MENRKLEIMNASPQEKSHTCGQAKLNQSTWFDRPN